MPPAATGHNEMLEVKPCFPKLVTSFIILTPHMSILKLFPLPCCLLLLWVGWGLSVYWSVNFGKVLYWSLGPRHYKLTLYVPLSSSTIHYFFLCSAAASFLTPARQLRCIFVLTTSFMTLRIILKLCSTSSSLSSCSLSISAHVIFLHNFFWLIF